MPDYRIIEGSPQDQFQKFRTTVQIFGGGYGNGKTAGAVAKALTLTQDYPGSNGLIARATYPKLNDTIRKEFLKWCPKEWIKSFPLSKNSDNTCVMKNGTYVNFRYIAQQGRSAGEGEQTTSNLLSATYDWIIVDQMEDPEITEKDFYDLMGRLRGSTPYIGDDPTMPRTGPRFFMITLNPTRNWMYRRIIEPWHQYQRTGVISENLLCVRHPRGHPEEGKPILGHDGKPQLIMSLAEGSTYTNKHNLDPSVLENLESTFTGQMRDRYLYGEWASYEGLVYPQFFEPVHMIPRADMLDYIDKMGVRGFEDVWIEGYDYGMIEPSCYGLAYVDRYGNVLVVDGFYKRDMLIDDQIKVIKTLRNHYRVPEQRIYGDPAIFKRGAGSGSKIGVSVEQIFRNDGKGVSFRRGNNELAPGIAKLSAYLTPKKFHRHPITGLHEAPHIYFASELEFIAHEMTSYYWKVNPAGERIDTPIDKNNHSLDMLRYMLTNRPDISKRIHAPTVPAYMHWHEQELELG